MTPATLFDAIPPDPPEPGLLSAVCRCGNRYTMFERTKRGAGRATKPVLRCPACARKRFDVEADRGNLSRAWDCLTRNVGLMLQQWRRGWRGRAGAWPTDEILSECVEAAEAAVARWRAGKGSKLTTYVAVAVYRTSRKACERHRRDRLRTGIDFDGMTKRAG